MDDSSKLGLSIVGAAAVLLVGFVAYREWSRHRDIAEATEAFQSVVTAGQQAMARSAAASREWSRRQAQRARVESARYVLAADQRCVGGVVVQVRGSVYTQLGSISQPIHCAGRRADKPLR
jgi:hypothetical protein